MKIKTYNEFSAKILNESDTPISPEMIPEELLKKYRVKPEKLKDGVYKGFLDISKLGLTNLDEFATMGIKSVWNTFVCSENQLTSLKGCPLFIQDSFDCSNNQLKTLEDGPYQVSDHYICSRNQLTNLDGCPSPISTLDCGYNKISVLKRCPAQITNLYLTGNPITKIDVEINILKKLVF